MTPGTDFHLFPGIPTTIVFMCVFAAFGVTILLSKGVQRGLTYKRRAIVLMVVGSWGAGMSLMSSNRWSTMTDDLIDHP